MKREERYRERREGERKQAGPGPNQEQGTPHCPPLQVAGVQALGL